MSLHWLPQGYIIALTFNLCRFLCQVHNIGFCFKYDEQLAHVTLQLYCIPQSAHICHHILVSGAQLNASKCMGPSVVVKLTFPRVDSMRKTLLHYHSSGKHQMLFISGLNYMQFQMPIASSQYRHILKLNFGL